MYTFIISVVFFFLLSALIFQKKLKENVLLTILIVFLGTIISTTIIGSTLINNIQYETKLVKSKTLRIKTSVINDSIKVKGYIHVDSVGSEIHLNILEFETKNGVNKLSFEYLEKGDTIPRYERYKDIPSINSKWIRARNFPRENKQYIVYLPDDSIHYVLINIANEIIKSYND